MHETTSTDAEGHTTTYVNDAFGQLVQVDEDKDTETYTTTYAYDLSGNLTTVTDDANNVTSMTYDRLGQKRTMDDPDSGDWTYVYDGVGNITSQQDGEGDWLYFEYDDLNRVLKRRSDSASGPVLAEYAYDAPFVGALDWSKANVTGGEVRIDHLSYDDAGRVLARTLTMPGSQVFREEFTYNNAGNMVTRAYPDGATGNTDEVVTYDYDAVSGLPETLTGDASFSDDDYVTSTTFNPFGQITAQQAGTGDGLYWDPAYDVHTRVERSLVRQGTSGGAISQDYNYDRDDNGLITRIWDDTVVNDQFQCFTYDDLGRLTTGFTGDWLCRWYRSNGPDPYYFSYQYDSIGNLTKKGGVTLTYSGVEAGPHAVTKYGTDDFAYDDNGNMTSRDIAGGTQTLAWDDDHQLDSVADTSGTTSFLYDADGNRVKRTTGSESTVHVGGVYEYTTAGANTTETSYYTVAGRTVAVRNGSDLHYLAQDHLGSTSLTRDGSSGSVAVHRYKPFGDPRGTSAPTETDHTYTGQIADGSTDLMFYNARYYDPTTARFISPDTIIPDPTNPQDLNRYSYVRNSPTNLVDPTGHCPEFMKNSDGGCWGAGVARAAVTFVDRTADGVAFVAGTATAFGCGPCAPVAAAAVTTGRVTDALIFGDECFVQRDGGCGEAVFYMAVNAGIQGLNDAGRITDGAAAAGIGYTSLLVPVLGTEAETTAEPAQPKRVGKGSDRFEKGSGTSYWDHSDEFLSLLPSSSRPKSSTGHLLGLSIE
ncbi:MAG: hypothetical protein KJP22_10450 [Acidimicrobiia bacterium]|nr:hypothetical protein [Acidimicrobiia bacterium]NNL69032.1 RHS repeat-associated core domain-containing protein [Acidimicrobiia bacterium]